MSVNYKDGVPTKITRVVLATQHDDLEQKFGNKEEAYKEIRSAITENIIVPAIAEFLIIDLLEPVLFVKSLLKIDMKNN